MDILLIVLGSICMLAGLAGVVLPILPASPLSYLGIILLHLTSRVQFSGKQLVFWAALVVLVQVFDYLTPILGAKRFGGSKQGIWGCSIGVVAGMFFFPPYGLILGPVVGAVVGELLAGKQSGAALKAGLGSFLGFLLGTVFKLVVSLYLIYQFVAALF
ncbi:MAG: DUF456 domain-containing protein [Bacteroidales bacterium]|jgi:hypothetical protein|nr:DUF456 domain-containing protein [Bacteroidales bacterium]